MTSFQPGIENYYDIYPALLRAFALFLSSGYLDLLEMYRCPRTPLVPFYIIRLLAAVALRVRQFGLACTIEPGPPLPQIFEERRNRYQRTSRYTWLGSPGCQCVSEYMIKQCCVFWMGTPHWRHGSSSFLFNETFVLPVVAGEGPPGPCPCD